VKAALQPGGEGAEKGSVEAEIQQAVPELIEHAKDAEVVGLPHPP
jgi:hypothetical protein